MIKIKQLHSECDQTCRAVVFETGWTTVRNWCPRTSVHQAGTRVKTWCLPPLLHKIFFCAREIVVAHSWAKLYVAITGETTLGLSTKRKTQSFFCVAFEESASLAFIFRPFSFFFLYRAWKKFEPRGCVSNGENFRIAHLFFFSSFFFLSMFGIWIALEWMEDTSESSMYDFIIWKWSMKKSFARIAVVTCEIIQLFFFDFNLSPWTSTYLY